MARVKNDCNHNSTPPLAVMTMLPQITLKLQELDFTPSDITLPQSRHVPNSSPSPDCQCSTFRPIFIYYLAHLRPTQSGQTSVVFCLARSKTSRDLQGNTMWCKKNLKRLKKSQYAITFHAHILFPSLCRFSHITMTETFLKNLYCP